MEEPQITQSSGFIVKLFMFSIVGDRYKDVRGRITKQIV